MSDFPAELSGAGIIERIESGQYPREVVETIARGFLPLPQDDLIAVLAFLTNSPDAAIAAAAQTSLTDVPSRSIHAFASNESAPAEHLALLMRATDDPFILEALIRNRAVARRARRRAGRASPTPPCRRSSSSIRPASSARRRSSTRCSRIRASPPTCAAASLETREEFFDKKARIAAASRPKSPKSTKTSRCSTLSEEPIADLLEKAVAEPDGCAAAGAHGIGKDGREEAVDLFADPGDDASPRRSSWRSRAARPSG